MIKKIQMIINLYMLHVINKNLLMKIQFMYLLKNLIYKNEMIKIIKIKSNKKNKKIFKIKESVSITSNMNNNLYTKNVK